MVVRRVRSEGEDVVRLVVRAVTFVCAAGHEWWMERATIMRDPDAAERCGLCGGAAVDAVPELQSGLERRGVVVELRGGDADA